VFPSYLIMPSKTMSEEEREKFAREWRARYAD
jgi:hypothetical protein